MPTYSYTAIEAATGRERAGVVEGASPELATAALKARGLAPMALAETPAAPPSAAVKAPARKGPMSARADRGGRPFSPGRGPTGKPAQASAAPGRRPPFAFGRAIDARSLALFTRQLATLVRAGLPLLRGLEVLARQEKNAGFRLAIEELAETIRSGGNLSDGLLRQPKIFDRLYVNMVRAGEAGGALDTVLERLAQFMEKTERIKAKVMSALTYPAIVMALAVGIVAALLVFVVPRFEQIFTGMLKGQPLPALTRLVMGASDFVQHHFVVALVVFAAGVAAFRLWRKTTFGEHALDGLAIRLPVLGELVRKAAIARFTRTFGTLLASGVPILPALIITRDTSGNVQVAEAIDIVHDRVKEGDNVAGPLEATAIFPGMVTSMIEVGEETGALPEMLTRIADTYDEEVDNAVAALTSLIEPVMIVLLALLVGTIVIALFLPVVSIIQHLQ